MDNNIPQKYGTLLQPSIKLHRKYFDEMVKLIGIYVLYYQLKEGTEKYTFYNEQVGQTNIPPMLVGCIFDEHPTQYTLRKMQWAAELQ